MGELLNVEEIFGEKVFTIAKMRERLPKKVFQEVTTVMEQGGELLIETIDKIEKLCVDKEKDVLSV